MTVFALLLGKPLGVVTGGLLAARLTGLGLPDGIATRDLLLLGLVAGCGFTVPYLVADAALPGGAAAEAAKLGIVATLMAAPIAVAVARLAGIGRWDKRRTA